MFVETAKTIVTIASCSQIPALDLGSTPCNTVAERDTAAAAKAALGPPESRRWPPKGRPSAAASRRGSAAPAKILKSLFSSRMVNWTMLGVVWVVEFTREFSLPRIYQK